MEKQKNAPTPNSSFSIDHWQDGEAVKIPWFDSPLWGALIICGVLVSLIAWSVLSSTAGEKKPTPAFANSEVELSGVFAVEYRDRIEKKRVHSRSGSTDAG